MTRLVARCQRLRKTISIRARRVTPAALRPALRSMLDFIDPLRVKWYRRRTGYRAPIAPRRLRARIGEPGIRRFIEHGRAAADAITAAAQAAGADLARAPAVLDFACGCGRVLQPLLHLRQGRTGLAGSDVDADAIGWLAGAVAGRADCRVNQFTPPLPFATGSFSAVYTLSSFTHLDGPTQDAWLAELERVLSPGGLALISVHGEHPYEVFRRGAQSGLSEALIRRLRRHRSLEEEGFIFEPYERRLGTESELPGIGTAYGLTFQHPRHVAQNWGKRFEIVDHAPLLIGGWQDLVILRRRPQG
jgi:SAM-dependent methyltransferase